MQLYLMRHAEAKPGGPDELRALTSTGRKAARALGEHLRELGVKPDAVVTSPLLRARETGAAVARVTGAPASADERLAPGATTDDLRAAVAGRGETIVVVGHQPDCGQIAADLTGDGPPPFPPAGMVRIALAD